MSTFTLTFSQMRAVSKKLAKKATQDYTSEAEAWEQYEPKPEIQALCDAAQAMNCGGADGIVPLAKALRPDLTLSEMDSIYIIQGGVPNIDVRPFTVLKRRSPGGLTPQFFLQKDEVSGFLLASKTKDGGHIQNIAPASMDVATEEEANAALDRVYLTKSFQQFLRSEIDKLYAAKLMQTDDEDLEPEDIVAELLAE